MPKIITFEGEDVSDGSIPPSIPKSSCNPEAEAIVLEFLKQYFTVYDSDNRQSLLDSYHEDAVMSMTSSYIERTNDHK